MSLKFRSLTLAVFWFSISPQMVFSAACCGGGAGGTALIVSDHQSSFDFSISQASVLGGSTGSGDLYTRTEDHREVSRSLNLGGATLLGDRIQLGGTTSFHFRSVNKGSTNETYENLGDTSFFLGYEALPEYRYSTWRPKIFTLLKVTLPTGNPPQSSKSLLQTDITTSGYTRITAGVLASKLWNSWAARISMNGTRAMIEGPEDFWGLDSSISVSYFFPGFFNGTHASISLSPNFETPSSGIRKVWPLSFRVGYALPGNTSLSVSYIDETLLASWSRNTILSQSFSIGLQKTWER